MSRTLRRSGCDGKNTDPFIRGGDDRQHTTGDEPRDTESDERRAFAVEGEAFDVITDRAVGNAIG